MAKWERMGKRLIPVSVNLSRQHFREPGFLEEFSGIAKQYRVRTEMLEFELTESIFLDEEQIDVVKDSIHRVHALGFTCSLDDFGSGFSSLGLLKEFDVDALKLDRLFFLDMHSEKARDVIACLMELAKKLKQVQDAGIPVLVIPGNHDINHPWAASYFDNKKEEAKGTTPSEFYEIYYEFGYDQASSRDEDSLSYLYRLDEHYWIMMLDSCIYEPVHETGGRIKKETLAWMERQLEEAKEAGAMVIPVAHHNLLKESTLYPEECTLENNREVIDLLEEYHLPVYISGHLHLQRIKKNVRGPLEEGEYGIYEIVSSSLAIPPCQYGIINWTNDGSFRYHTKEVDISGWAERYQEEDPNLLNFKEYSSQFLVDIISNQTFKGLESIPDERKREMAQLYGDLNSAYCSGKPINAARIKSSRTYFYWERYLGTSKWFDRLSAILKDTKKDHNSLSLKAGKDFPAWLPAESGLNMNKE